MIETLKKGDRTISTGRWANEPSPERSPYKEDIGDSNSLGFLCRGARRLSIRRVCARLGASIRNLSSVLGTSASAGHAPCSSIPQG
jgi:hypothetical protein